MIKYLIKNAQIVNENKNYVGDILISNQRIEKIGSKIQEANAIEIDAENHYCFPGAIDDQVHFREPGLTHKATIYSESRAAVAGGVTTFFEMPNTVPQATTQALLEEKFQIASKNSLANYSFFMGTTNDNYEEVIKTNPLTTCGIKIFMGSSTGNMLVDNQTVLERVFANAPTIIATHCEDEATIKNNLALYTEKYGDRLDATFHAKIRNSEACFLSSSMAIDLAKKNNTRLHILHISTARETFLFDNSRPLKDKKITSEACIHHLWFSDKDYATKGNWIKWNPAIKSEEDRDEIWKALLDGRIDVIATDHAPHTIEEKSQPYSQAPSGGPLVQHSWQAMLDFYEKGKIKLETIVEKMCHNPAILFNVKERGYIREGYFADLVLVKKEVQKVSKENLFYKCQWSPFDQHKFQYTIKKTFVNGHLVYENEKFNESKLGQRINFER